MRRQLFGTVRSILASVLFVGLFAVGTASAVTIAGDEYEEILSFTTTRDFGYWTSQDKFYTFRGNDNYIRSIPVSRVTSRSDDLDGVQFREVFVMGTVDGDLGPVDSGVVNLIGRGGEELLTTQFVSNGSVNPIYQRGFAGQLDVNGIFEVTGGSLFANGLVTGPLYVEIAFDYVWQPKYADLWANRGSFTFFERVGPGNPGPDPEPVPEPATMVLLASSLIGGLRLRRKRQE